MGTEDTEDTEDTEVEYLMADRKLRNGIQEGARIMLECTPQIYFLQQGLATLFPLVTFPRCCRTVSSSRGSFADGLRTPKNQSESPLAGSCQEEKSWPIDKGRVGIISLHDTVVKCLLLVDAELRAGCLQKLAGAEHSTHGPVLSLILFRRPTHNSQHSTAVPHHRFQEPDEACSW